jgi:hypothetical protein
MRRTFTQIFIHPQAGLSPKEVPLSIIHPLLQAAVAEEDPELQTLWANLLANAADPRSQGVHKAFVNTLREMSPREAQVIQDMNRDRIELSGPDLIAGYCDGSIPEGNFLYANLVRLGLKGVRTEVTVPHHSINAGTFGSLPTDQEESYYLSGYGLAFAAACTAPKPTQMPGGSK